MFLFLFGAKQKIKIIETKFIVKKTKIIDHLLHLRKYFHMEVEHDKIMYHLL